MSRILVVEPRNLLRQAISLALSRDHEVQVASALSDSDLAGALECDLVIIDAAALRGTSHWSSQLVPTVEGWKIPTIWIDDGGGSAVHARDTLVVLNKPIQKDALQAVVTKCLGMSATEQNGAPDAAVEEGTATNSAITAVSQGAQMIELVHVVAEPPERRKRRGKR
ncbi:MAG TPA: hypothetical protein VEG60_05430 [Candidatus Binatia bacterium]|nr:hypothetical protein [Candidatus Binatia bacterium]